MVMIWCHLVSGLKTRYKWVDLASLCSHSPETRIIYLDQADSLLLTYNTSPTYQVKCHLELRLPSDKLGFSVFMEEMKLETRDEKCGSDFVQFGR